MPRQLVVQLARFGDLLQTKRLIRSLEKRGETHLCVDHSLAQLAKRIYPAIHVHGVHAHAQGSHTMGADAVHSLFLQNKNSLGELASLEWDAVYNCNYSGLNLAISKLFPAAIVHGHRLEKGQALRDFWPSLAFRWTKQRQSSPLNLVDFWAWLVGRDTPPLKPESVNPLAIAGGRGVGVVLAGRNARRSLPMDVLVPLVQAAMQGVGARQCWLLGSKSERPAARAFLREAPHSLQKMCTDLCGKTDWIGLEDALQGLDLLVTPDTGTMHLACHLGTPVLACFLSSAWVHETGPYGAGHITLQAVEYCAPCVESRPCHNDIACLAPFRAKETLRAIAMGLDFAGKGLPGGLVAFGNVFDAAGQICTPLAGEDSFGQQRAAQRGALAKYLLGEDCNLAAEESVQAFAREFWQERDWLLGDDTCFSGIFD